ncbi:MAG: ABC-type uncharacterized transport system permease subunit [Pseudomonadales bacterium]
MILLIALALYSLLIVMLIQQATGNSARNSIDKTFVLGIAALSAHGYVCFNAIYSPSGLVLDFFPIAALIGWFVAATTLVGSLRIAIDKLLIPLYALAALTLLAMLLFPQVDGTPTKVSPGISAHIIISILAYSILTIAACQAIALWLQNHALKSHQVSGIIKVLPPLQTMEEMLFQMITSGTALLAGSIITGAIFLDDIFAQQLVHKTTFSIAALAIFSVLLWGRHQNGWRGTVAIRWTLIGFVALMLGYFGSKFVLELILQK